MKIRKLIILVIILSGFWSASAQEKEILITVSDVQVTVEEFEWLYQKNNSGNLFDSIDKYLSLYIDLRLKVEEAKEAGIHLTKAFKYELEGYRNQLSKNYLTDQNIREELLRKAYERYMIEINVYHILIKCPADATPADTLDAFVKAMNIRERIRIGEAFESVARGSSDDPSVTINGGNIGYFTVFQTPLSFENAAYSMKIGQLSKPVRTADGYHIIKIQDRRDNQGRIKVAHIMKATPMGTSELSRRIAKNQIDSLYNLLQEGSDFQELAMNNSDDQMSSANGGELPWFGAGRMIHEFSFAAFQLQRDGEISEPVKTAFGWHIIKRLSKEAFPAYEDAKRFLEGRLSQSYLQSVSRKSFVNNLKEEYNYTINNEALEWFYSISDSSFRAGNFFEDLSQVSENVLYSFANEELSMKEFAIYINDSGNQAPSSDSLNFINTLLDQKSHEQLVEYEDSMLEEKYPDFKYLMREFYDGILFFEISDSLIWKRSVNDSIKLKRYYETRISEFMLPATAEARIYKIESGTSNKNRKDLVKKVKKFYKNDNYRELILSGSVSGKDTLISITEGIWEKGVNTFIDRVKWSKGIHQADNNGTVLVDIIDIIEPQPQSFTEVRAVLSNDFQKQLEEEWLIELRNRYGTHVNEEALLKLKQKYK